MRKGSKKWLSVPVHLGPLSGVPTGQLWRKLLLALAKAWSLSTVQSTAGKVTASILTGRRIDMMAQKVNSRHPKLTLDWVHNQAMFMDIASLAISSCRAFEKIARPTMTIWCSIPCFAISAENAGTVSLCWSTNQFMKSTVLAVDFPKQDCTE